MHSFADAQGNKHLPGDIVDLPASYRGEKWLEPLEVESRIRSVPTSKIKPGPEKMKSIVVPDTPLSEKNSKKTK